MEEKVDEVGTGNNALGMVTKFKSIIYDCGFGLMHSDI